MEDRDNKNSKQRDQSAAGFRKTGIIVILVFLILLICVTFADNVWFSSSSAEVVAQTEKSIQVDIRQNSIWDGVYTLLMNVAAVGITIGAGTVLYAHFDFVKYVKNELCKVILEYHFIDRLNDKEKDLLMRRLQKYLIYHDTESGNDTLYDFVNKEVRTLTKGAYYEKMSANVNCKLQGDMLIKHIVRQMTINYQQQEDFQFDLGKLTRCYFYGEASGAGNDPSLVIRNLVINGNDMMDKVERQIVSEKDDRGYGYFVEYRFKEGAGIDNLRDDRILEIKIDYTTRVYKSDKSLCFRTYYPCKALDAVFVHEPSLKANADVFCFKDRKTDGSLDRERVQILQLENCIKIDFQDWLLPGDGIIYYIEEAERAKEVETSADLYATMP